MKIEITLNDEIISPKLDNDYNQYSSQTNSEQFI